MPPKDQKPWTALAIEALGNTIGQRIVTGLTLTLLAFMVSTGKGMVRSVYAQETRKVMRAPMDSMQLQIDTIKVNQKGLTESVLQMQRAQLEMYSAQLQKDTALRRILEDRAANSRKAAEARASTEKLFQDLNGGTP